LIVLGHRRARSGRRSLARRLAMVAPASVWLVPEGSPAKIDDILVPIDFSDHSADAVAVAAAIARARGLGSIRAVHVFFDPSTIRYDEHVEEIRGQEEAAFERFIEPIDRQGVDVEPVFIEGTRTARDILSHAERSGTDLIVMNTRGRSHAAGVLLGSVTSDTMQGTKIPLLAVKHFGSRMTLREALVNHRIWDQPAPKMN
jgi:nucleotide-binding universal stress UspA family protein